MNKLSKALMKAINNPYLSLASDGESAGSKSTFINTGSYALNAVISGSIFGGIPSNKITMIAGEPSTGKTFFSLSIVKHFLEDDLEAIAFYFETEGAISKEMLEERGIDSTRVIIVEVSTAEEFRNNTVQMIDEYLKSAKKDRTPVLCVLDSMGMLSTEKESADAGEGKNTRDMTRAQVLKSAFRTITLKLSRADIPMIVVNHVYDSMDAYSPKVVSGGKGSQYASSTIISLSKSKAVGSDTGGKSADKARVGSIISCTASKSRLTIEMSKIKTLLHYQHGLDKYFGLFDMARSAGLLEKEGNRFKNTLTGELLWGKDIVNPKKAHLTFTQDFLIKLDVWVQANFKYGAIGDDADLSDELTEDDETETETEGGE